jgi:ferredoxin
MVLYFTATGNSLYAAKQFDMELVSIPQELKKADRHYKADSIGVVCPLYELDMPDVIKEFIKNSEFETDYFYIVITYGCHHGGVAERVQAYLETIGKKADYINTVIMHDNALPVFDMEEQKRLDPDKQVDEHLAAIKADIDGKKREIQFASQREKDFYQGFVSMIKENGPMLAKPYYRVTEDCIGCGICSRVCPMGCVNVREGRAEHDYTDCVSCMACIHACPQKSIQFATFKEVNPEHRYRNPNIPLREIIAGNCQK